MKKVPSQGYITIYLSIYRRSVVVFYNTDVDGILRVLEKKIKVTDQLKTVLKDVYDEGGSGFTMSMQKGGADLMIILKEKPQDVPTVGVLLHELLHAVDTIAEQIDPGHMMFDKTGGSEARAYLFEYMANECLAALHLLPARVPKK